MKKNLTIFLLLFIVFFISLFTVTELVFSQTTDAVNVDLTITAPPTDSGGGGGPGDGGDDPPPEEEVSGCTDPLAFNYDSTATVDDGSCQYMEEEIPNVSDFTAEYNLTNNNVSLTWQNPDFPEFSLVRVIRKVGSVPADPLDGVVIYSNSGESTTDNDLEADTSYYYGAFVRNNDGEYSSGSIAFVTTPAEEEEECTVDCEEEESPGEEDVPPGEDDPGDGDPSGDPGGSGDGGPAKDPFEDFPEATTVHPQIDILDISDFTFLQPGERPQIFNTGNINVDGEKELVIQLQYDKVPPVLKTIAVTFRYPDDNNKVLSFLLKPNSQKTHYTARIAPLEVSGRYPVTIYILNYEDQTMKKIGGNINVAGATLVSDVPQRVVSEVLLPVSIISGVVAGAAQGFLLTSTIASFSDFYLLLLRALGALLGALGIKKRHKPWGTVYDSVTKRPIDPAYVTVMPADKPDDEVSSAITDIDGRYGFFLPAGSYIIKAGKTHYKFPSEKLIGQEKDELYNNLYFGEPVTSESGEVINKNIPLDPVEFDWNEFTKGKTSFFKVYSHKEAKRDRIFNVIYGVGFVAAVASLVFFPSVLNIVAVAVYILIFAGQKIWQYKHKVISIKRNNGEPIPFAIVRFYYADLDQEVKHVVADHLGRFYALLRPGTYYYTVEEKMPDGSYSMIKKSDPIELKKGVLDHNIVV